MEAHLRELADLVIRWVHLIAGIMWIGNSLLFNWLDRNLEKPKDAPPGYDGKIWLLHSGGFYEVDKKQLEPGQMPPNLHWFKWQNFSTWASGILLLFVVYYAGKGALLVDPSVRSLNPTIAMVVGISSVVVSWLVYDISWSSPLAKRDLLASILSFAYVVGLAYALTHILSGRAAYIHVGVTLGSIMTGNVWFVIVPSQRELVAATKEGRPQDPKIGKRAKQRSIHNNYMTFPLLFIMISNHFPSTYGNKLAWIVLAVISVGGALVRHLMNIRFFYAAWLPWATGVVLVTLGSVFLLTKPKEEPERETIATYAEARHVIDTRCIQCHSAHPTDDTWKVAPNGIKMDSEEEMRALAPRIKERAGVQKTMPLGNKTRCTEEERATLRSWVDHGAQ
ncbi:urate hydroxylase PuuD [soil metagenome]